jgi:hypothetical protein
MLYSHVSLASMHSFLAFCLVVAVSADTDLQNVSSYGLQNCYCNDCDPSKTIGKIFDGACYFLTSEKQFEVGHKYSSTVKIVVNSSHYSEYDVVSHDTESTHVKTVFNQVSNEFVLKNIERSIKVAVFFKQDSSAQCVHIFKRKYLPISCESSNMALLRAYKGEFVNVEPFVPPAYKKCSFNNNGAASISSPKTCFLVKEDGLCTPASLQSESDLNNVFDYLIAKTQVGTSVSMMSKNLMFKIETLNDTLDVNDYALVFSRVQLDDNTTCLYIDVGAKAIWNNRCTTNQTLCQIQETGDRVITGVSEESQTSSVWVVFAALTCVIVSLIFVMLLVYAMQGFQNTRRVQQPLPVVNA